MWFKVVFSLVLVLLVHGLYAQEGTYCRTPLRDPGRCIHIRRCDGLIYLLRTQSNNPEVRSYLMKSTCGYFGNEPLVCCPRLGKNENTPQTERTTTTTTTAAPTTIVTPIENVEDRTNTYTLPSVPQCGIGNGSEFRIVNGKNAELGQFPWMVALGYTDPKNPGQPRWLCGGTLITDKHVVTAGHCVVNRDDLYTVRVGELDLYSETDGASPMDIPILSKKLHEAYEPNHFTSDVAIITLANKVENPTVVPICLPTDESLRSQTFENYRVFVAGWGSIYFNGPSSSILQYASVPVVSTSTCKNAFENIKQAIIDERVICAGYTDGSKDSCKGDSGGPLMLGKQRPGSTNFEFYLVGVVSYGYRCAEPGYYGVYSRTTSFLDWISKNLN